MASSVSLSKDMLSATTLSRPMRLGKAERFHEKPELHGDHHKSPVDSDGQSVDVVRHPHSTTPSASSRKGLSPLGRSSRWLRNAEAGPFEDTRSARRWPTTEVAEHVRQQMRPDRRQKPLIADDVITPRADLMECMNASRAPIRPRGAGLASPFLRRISRDESGEPAPSASDVEKSPARK